MVIKQDRGSRRNSHEVGVMCICACSRGAVFLSYKQCASALVVPCEPRIARVEGTARPNVSFLCLILTHSYSFTRCSHSQVLLHWKHKEMQILRDSSICYLHF